MGSRNSECRSSLARERTLLSGMRPQGCRRDVHPLLRGLVATLVLCGGAVPVHGGVTQAAGRVGPNAEASLDEAGRQQLLPGLAEAAGDDGRSVDTPNLFASITVAFGSAECGGVLHHAMFDADGGAASLCAMTVKEFAKDVASRGFE